MSYRKVSRIAMVALVGMLLACGDDQAPLTEPDVSDLTGLDAAKGGGKGKPGGGGGGSGDTFTIEVFINNSLAGTAVMFADDAFESTLGGGQDILVDLSMVDVPPGANCQAFHDAFAGGYRAQGKVSAGKGSETFVHADFKFIEIPDAPGAIHTLELGPVDSPPIAWVDEYWLPTDYVNSGSMHGTQILFKGSKGMVKKGGCADSTPVQQNWEVRVTRNPPTS